MEPATSSAKSSAHCWYDPAVYAAAKAGDLSKVQAFIQAGGWVDMPDAKGNSMFYYACKKGQIEVVGISYAKEPIITAISKEKPD